jgi:hypothetical protein
LWVTCFWAWAAIDARNRTAELAAREFETDKTLEILASVYSEILKARDDEERAQWSCFFVATLGNAEAQARQQPPYFVRTFVEDVARAGLWNPDCASRLEALVSKDQPAATGIDAESIAGADNGVDAPEGPQEIGQWHALIASYNVTGFGCSEAQADVAHFSKALAGKGIEGRFVYVVRTAISNNYAVTVDAGDNESLAQDISAKIRAAAPGDGTGRDSFVQGNRGWTIDPACVAFARIAS